MRLSNVWPSTISSVVFSFGVGPCVTASVSPARFVIPPSVSHRMKRTIGKYRVLAERSSLRQTALTALTDDLSLLREFVSHWRRFGLHTSDVSCGGEWVRERDRERESERALARARERERDVMSLLFPLTVFSLPSSFHH